MCDAFPWRERRHPSAVFHDAGRFHIVEHRTSADLGRGARSTNLAACAGTSVQPLAAMRALHPDAVGPRPIAEFTNLVADLCETHDPATPVPTCGEWTLADLGWHLAEVQYFWTHILRVRPADREGYEAPNRASVAETPHRLRSWCADLTEQLATADPSEAAWSWHGVDQTVGFTRRRQTQEALIHCFDAVLAVDAASPAVDPRLAADGVDEMLRIMLGGEHPAFQPDSAVIEIRATDTEDIWSVRTGTIGGEAAVQVLDTVSSAAADPPSASFVGPALDLDLWLWRRADGQRIRSMGDPSAVAAFEGFVSATDLQ